MTEQRMQKETEYGDYANRLARLKTQVLRTVKACLGPAAAKKIDHLYRVDWSQPIPFRDFGFNDLEEFLLSLDCLTAQHINHVWHFSAAPEEVVAKRLDAEQSHSAKPSERNSVRGRGQVILPPAVDVVGAGFGRGFAARMALVQPHRRLVEPQQQQTVRGFGRGLLPRGPPSVPDVRPNSVDLVTHNLSYNGEGEMNIEDNLALLKDMYPVEDESSLRSLLRKCGNNLSDVLDLMLTDSPSKNKDIRSEETELATTVDGRKRKLDGGKVDSPQKQERLSADHPEDQEEAPGPSGLNEVGRSPTTTAPTSDLLCLISDDDVQKVAGFLNSAERTMFDGLCGVFPDADPSYIVQLIVERDGQGSRDAETIAHSALQYFLPQCMFAHRNMVMKPKRKSSAAFAFYYMMITRGYPKLRDRLQREKAERRRNDFLDPALLDVDDFLRIFDDPEAYFCDLTRKVSNCYYRHALVFLMNTFMNMRLEFLEFMLKQHDNHLLPAFREIQAAEENNTAKRGRQLNKRRRFPVVQYATARERRTRPEPWPEHLDEGFFREVQFIRNEAKIRAHMESKRLERENRFGQAKENGDLVECPICLNNECLSEEMLSCSLNRHSFCRDCVRRYSDEQIGGGSHRVACMVEGCAADFSLETLQSALRPETFSLLLRRRQTAELRQADIENLEQCPNCDFAMVIENTAERLFRCRNRDCLKETCRECRKPSHIPLRCEEVEHDEETRMRTFVEERMAEALIRTCPSCRSRIVKSDGCNKMVCTSCGCIMCYVCNQSLPTNDPYSHFNPSPHEMMFGRRPTNAVGQNNKCLLHTPEEMVHTEVARKAGEEAKKLFRIENPDAKTRKEKDVDVSKLVDADTRGERLDMPVGRRVYLLGRQEGGVGVAMRLMPPRLIPPHEPDEYSRPPPFAVMPHAPGRQLGGYGRGYFPAPPEPFHMHYNLQPPRVLFRNRRLPPDFEIRLVAVERKLQSAVVSDNVHALQARATHLRHNGSPEQFLRELDGLEAEVADLVQVADVRQLNDRISSLEEQVEDALGGSRISDDQRQLFRHRIRELRLRTENVRTHRHMREMEQLLADISVELRRRAFDGDRAVPKTEEKDTTNDTVDSTQDERLSNIKLRIKQAQVRVRTAPPMTAEARAAVFELRSLVEEQQQLNEESRLVDANDVAAAAVSMGDFEEQKRKVLVLDEKVRTLQKAAEDSIAGSFPEREIMAQVKATLLERDAAIRRRNDVRDQLLRRGAKDGDFGPDSGDDTDTESATCNGAKTKSAKRDSKKHRSAFRTKKSPQMPPEVFSMLREHKEKSRHPGGRDHMERVGECVGQIAEREERRRQEERRANVTDWLDAAHYPGGKHQPITFDAPSTTDDQLRAQGLYDSRDRDPWTASTSDDEDANMLYKIRQRSVLRLDKGGYEDDQGDNDHDQSVIAERLRRERLREEQQQEAAVREQVRIRRWEQLGPVLRQATSLLDLFGQANMPANAEIVRQIEEVVLISEDRGHEFNWPELLTTAREFVTARTPNVGMRMLELLHAFVDSLKAFVEECTPDAGRMRRIAMWRALLTERLSSQILKEAQATGADATVTDKAKMAAMVAERERQLNDEQRVLMEADRRQREIAERLRRERLQHEEAEQVARLQRERERRADLCLFCLEHDTYHAQHADCPFRDCTCVKCNGRRKVNERRRIEQRLDHLRGRLAAETGLLRDLDHLGAEHEQQQRDAVERLSADVHRLRTQIADQTRELERIRIEREQNEADLIRSEAALLVHRRRLLDSQAQQRRRLEVQMAETRLAEDVRMAERRLAQLNDDHGKVDELTATASAPALKPDDDKLSGIIQEYLQKGFDINTIESQLRRVLDIGIPTQPEGTAVDIQTPAAGGANQAIVLSSDEDDDVPAVVFESSSSKKRYSTDVKRERNETTDRKASIKDRDASAAELSTFINSQPIRLLSVQDVAPRTGLIEPSTVQSANIHINIHLAPDSSPRRNDGDQAATAAPPPPQAERVGQPENDLMDVE